jgi:hypothetical protein
LTTGTSGFGCRRISPIALRIRPAVAPTIERLLRAGDYVDAGVIADVRVRASRTDIQIGGEAVNAVLQAVAVGVPSFSGDAVVGLQQVVGVVFHSPAVALQHEDELILGRVPVARTGSPAGRQAPLIVPGVA